MSIAAVLFAAIGLVAVGQGTASAGGYGCAGNSVGSWPVKSPWKYIGDIKLYYNPSNGYNCAVFVKRAEYQGPGYTSSMYVRIINARYAEDNARGNIDEDSGNFDYYAGPVKVYGKNMCVSVDAMAVYGAYHPGEDNEIAHGNTGAVGCH